MKQKDRHFLFVDYDFGEFIVDAPDRDAAEKIAEKFCKDFDFLEELDEFTYQTCELDVI